MRPRYLTYIFLFSVALLKAQWPDTLRVCAGDSAILDMRSALDKRSNVYWSTPAGIITNAYRLAVTREGRYKVSYYSEKRSSLVTDSTYLKHVMGLRKQVRDTVICKGQSLVLGTGLPGLRHQWNTGARTVTISVRNEAVYWVRLSNGVCQSTDSFRVKVRTPNRELLPRETYFCLNENKRILSVKTQGGEKLLWNTGATSPSIAVSREGWYWVQSETYPCGTVTDSCLVSFKACECEMMIPNSFTPNEDGRNDYFFPVMECEYSYYSLSISDRWGNTVYTTYQSTAKWDGRFKGNLCPEDIYVYKLETQEKGSDKKKLRTGYISLFR